MGRLVTYTPHWTLSEILGNEDQRRNFIRILNEEKIEELASLPGIIDQTLPENASNIGALRRMADNRVEALVVVDGSHKPIGMVERDQLVPKLLVSLSQGT